MQRIDGKPFNFILPDDMRERLEKVAKATDTTLSEACRNTMDVGLDVFDIFYGLGLFTIFGKKNKSIKDFVREQLTQV